MGRQHAALLWPDYEVVSPLVRGSDASDRAALIGDLLNTHQGECFQFRHLADAPTPDGMDKFALWPSVRRPTESRGPDLRLEVQHDLEFEDLYLELMLRFFSSCSPGVILVAKLLEPGNHQSMHLVGMAHGVIDLGYLMRPPDARLLVKRSRTREGYTPIPARRYIPEKYMQSFEAIFVTED